MKESEVIIFVDCNPDTTSDKVQHFVRSRVNDEDEKTKFVLNLSQNRVRIGQGVPLLSHHSRDSHQCQLP